MKKLKKAVLLLAFSMVLSIVTPSIMPQNISVQTVEAASKGKLSKTKATLLAGQSLQLKLSGISGKVKWSTSKSSVAAVSSRGKVTAKKAGSAIITAKVGNKKFTCKITVEAPQISAKTLKLSPGSKKTLSLKGTKQKITWTSSKKSVATVSSKGVVTAKKAGTAVITAKVGSKRYTCKVTVAASVKLSKQSVSLEPKEKYTLKITGTKSKVAWTSSNKSVATVTSKGIVTAKKSGKATITAKVGGKKYTCKVTVIQEPNWAVSVSGASESSVSLIPVYIQNKGTKPLRVYSKRARLSDYDYSVYDRDLTLIGLSDDEQNIEFYSWQQIPAGGETILIFYTPRPTFYDMKSKIYFQFAYDGRTYEASCSYYFGSTYW